VIGAIRLKEEMGKDAVVVTLLCDDNKKYLSTDLMKDEPVKDGYLSGETEFRTYRTIKRADLFNH
jgi:cysteine synthase A